MFMVGGDLNLPAPGGGALSLGRALQFGFKRFVQRRA